MQFDASYTPVAAGGMLFVPSMVADSVTAYDTATGAERWRFHADGPVRFAPVAWAGKVYFTSDDGYLYCVDAAAGTLLWRCRGGPADRKVLGHGRLISTWPARGGPVLLDETVYFTAGVWPLMGIFVRAVDATTGDSLWCNSGEGSTYMIQPHNSPAFSGFVPRGHLAATARGLVVPSGRMPPACYDLETGRMRGFHWPKHGGRAAWVAARDKWFFAGGTMYQVADGRPLLTTPAAVLDERALYYVHDNALVARALHVEEQEVEATDRKGKPVKRTRRRLEPLWEVPLPDGPSRLFLKAGSRFVLGGQGIVSMIEVDPARNCAEAVWTAEFLGRPWTMLAADDKLFVVTLEGRVYCFGQEEGEPRMFKPLGSGTPPLRVQAHGLRPVGLARRILQETRITGGYCVMLGLDGERLPEKLLRRSQLQLIVIDADADKIKQFRRRMDDAGLYGTRVAACVGDPASYPLPPYLAELIVVADRPAESEQGVSLVRAVFHALRPYGGTAVFAVDADALERWTHEAGLEGARVKPFGKGKGRSLLIRPDSPTGAADWTHNYGDAAQSVVSTDARVRLPLGLLWFGGPSNDDVLPRHGHGPSPQVAAGRVFVEGRNMLRAVDIYTGRLLWQKDIPDLGEFHDITRHQPGAGEIGGNYVSLADSVYVVHADAILRLDAATGRLMQRFTLETTPDGSPGAWGFLAAWKDLLVATSTPVGITAAKRKDAEKRKEVNELPSPGVATPGLSAPEPKPEPQKTPTLNELLVPTRYASASRRLVVMNRHTGAVLWQRQAKYGFRHNNIAVGSGRVFCIDGLSRGKRAMLKRRGVELADYAPRLLALDARSGKEIWSATEDVFGTFLSYSVEHDVLLQTGSPFRDRAADEARAGMVAYRGADGRVLWKDLDRKLSGPCMIHHDTIITQRRAYSLLTGRPKTRRHPLSGRPVAWTYFRNYGCGTATGAEHLLLFRSAAAGYFDLDRDGGTGNLGGFRSGCTSNLIAAGGLLVAPDFTRTCTCNYQNQTSVAMIHDPRVEVWTFNALAWDEQPVRRVGINFGAPGDRRAAGGTLWLDWPSRGGPSPDLPIHTDPKEPETFRHHSSLIRVVAGSEGLAWVAASGLKDVRAVTITLAKQETSENVDRTLSPRAATRGLVRASTISPRRYTVRLHFIEPEGVGPGRRIFDVRVQDKIVIRSLDVADRVGPMTALVETVRGVPAGDTLKVSLEPHGNEEAPGPILCGIEIVAEK
jgi:outer membrane protein assembly factor BamB